MDVMLLVPVLIVLDPHHIYPHFHPHPYPRPHHHHVIFALLIVVINEHIMHQWSSMHESIYDPYFKLHFPTFAYWSLKETYLHVSPLRSQRPQSQSVFLLSSLIAWIELSEMAHVSIPLMEGTCGGLEEPTSSSFHCRRVSCTRRGQAAWVDSELSFHHLPALMHHSARLPYQIAEWYAQFSQRGQKTEEAENLLILNFRRISGHGNVNVVLLV